MPELCINLISNNQSQTLDTVETQIACSFRALIKHTWINETWWDGCLAVISWLLKYAIYYKSTQNSLSPQESKPQDANYSLQDALPWAFQNPD